MSAGGATIQDVLEHQLAMVDIDSADLILIVTASDLEKRVPLDRYRSNLQTLSSSLAAHKTIYSDFPIEPGREAYQAAFQQAADECGMRRADFALVFNGEGRRLDIFSWLLPHLNSRGYYYWFLAFRPEVDRIANLNSIDS